MQTSKFTLIPPEIKPGDLLPALETVTSPETIEQANCAARSASLPRSHKNSRARSIRMSLKKMEHRCVYRLITDLIDIALFPALLLAREYHLRWEAENTRMGTKNSSQCP